MSVRPLCMCIYIYTYSIQIDMCMYIHIYTCVYTYVHTLGRIGTIMCIERSIKHFIELTLGACRTFNEAPNGVSQTIHHRLRRRIVPEVAPAIPKWTPKWMPKCSRKRAPKMHPRSHSQGRPCTHSVQRFVRIPYKKCRRTPFLQTSLPKFALYGFRTKPKSKK